MIRRLCAWHGCQGASPKPLQACASTARGTRLKRLAVLADEVRTALECSSRAVWVGCMMSEKLEGRKRLLTKPAAHRSHMHHCLGSATPKVASGTQTTGWALRMLQGHK